MPLDLSIFKSYDIRGIYPEQINEDNIALIAGSIASYFQQHLGRTNVRIGLGHDMRLSAGALYPIIKKTLVESGAAVTDFDLLSTPTFYYAIRHFKLDAGILLSASHNPPKYNGCKIVLNKDDKLFKVGAGSGMEEIKAFAQGGRANLQSGGFITENSQAVSSELDNLGKLIEWSAISGLKIVADAGNAMGSTYMKGFFEKTDCVVDKLHFDLDGNFPAHDPDPLIEKNITELKSRVIETKSDVGIATDGDGDRIIFVTEKGESVSGPVITALIAKYLLEKKKGETIVYNITQTMTPNIIVAENGGISHVSPVGHANMTAAMHKTGAIFGGEVSGHFFYRETGGAESGLLTLGYLLTILAKEGKAFSELVDAVSRSYSSGELNYKVDNAKVIMEAIKDKYNEGRLVEIDGVAIDYSDWRVSLRSSNTEPLLRLCVEAKTKDKMEKMTSEIDTIIKSFGAERHNA